ncbi:hypothetical protein AB0B45_38605 [Nonomuraea sp. NPDC049152]|uniref:hypothetical protein n=1 Tax=Nonomuraea sp. NPDC049152 TaxID=3154350 RepID=UPI0033CD9AD0
MLALALTSGAMAATTGAANPYSKLTHNHDQTVPSTAAHRADVEAVFTLTQLSGPAVGEVALGYGVMAAKDAESPTTMINAMQAVNTRLPFSKSFTVEPNTCAFVLVWGKKGAELRVDVSVGGDFHSKMQEEGPVNFYCNV